MKKIFLSIILVVMLIVIPACGDKEVEIPENKQLTLEEFVKSSKYKNVISNLKCEALKNNSVVKSISYNTLLLSDGYVYTTVQDRDITYANGEQCKKLDDKLKFTRIYGNNYFLGEDGKVYTYYNDQFKEYENSNYYIPNDNTVVDFSTVYMTDEEKEQYKSTNKYVGRDYVTYDFVKYIVLRTDGNVYETIYHRTNNYNKKSITYKIEKEKVILSKNNYGSIKSYNITTSGTKYKIYGISTNNGFYNLKVFENEECKKYEDVACEEKLVLNDGYLKYSSEIKYIDYNIIVTNNNSVLPTSVFMGRNY